MHIHFDKSKLLDSITSEYAFAERTLALVPTERVGEAGVCGYWSVKDLVAHLTHWEQRTLHWIADSERGIPLRVPEEGYGWNEFDAINDYYYRQFKDESYSGILESFKKVQLDIVTMVNRLTEEELAGEGRMAAMFIDSPADAIAGNTFQHFEVHIPQIRDWLNRRL